MRENIDFWFERFEAEQPAFRKVLMAMPADKLDYRPHEKSTGAGRLAWQLAEEQLNLVEMLTTGSAEFVARKRPESLDGIVALWDERTAKVLEFKGKVTDEQWEGKGDFSAGGQSVWSDTLKNLAWGFLFDMVHHRGQLSSYLRPMGGKVPAIYGPSGDEQQ